MKNSVKTFTFPRGVHFDDMKSLSSSSAIEIMPQVENYFVALSQHIGAPAVAIVAEGQSVVEGQLIGQAAAGLSANIYSPVCGDVVGIVTHKNVSGVKASYIQIKANGKTDKLELPKLASRDRQSIVERISLAGIVGLGGAGFPTAVKVTPKNPVDTLIINAAECEPYLTCDYRVMLEQTDKFIAGCKLLAQAVGVSNIVIGIEKNKMDVYDILSKLEGVTVKLLVAKYPQGAEKHLIYACTGRTVPVKKLPSDVGVIVQNVQTAVAVYEAVEDNKPLYQRVMTVSGKGVNTPKNLLVKVGTSYADILEYCGGIKEETVKLISGGPMMGKACVNVENYTTKTDSGLLALVKGEAFIDDPTPCLRCGKCVAVCPMHLSPVYIDFNTLVGDTATAIKYGALDCCECGSCAFVCPARRPIVESVRLTKIKSKERK